MYDLIRPLLFRLDPERAHALGHAGLGAVEHLAPLRKAWEKRYVVQDPRLAVELPGLPDLRFPNPLGLAAGFDKDGEHPRALSALGFGFVELGTVTALPQPGNPSPRLFRLPEDGALLNRMGFNNHGAVALGRRLRGKAVSVPVGVNLGKSKVTPNEEALDDYLTSLVTVHDVADYLVVNVSSPNTPGLRALQEREPLQRLLSGLQARLAQLGAEDGGPKKPLFLKLAPDLTDAQLDDVIELLAAAPVEGLIATNTTISRDGLRTPADTVTAMGTGGISGAPLRARSTEVIRRLYRGTAGKVPIIGVGGISTGADVVEKFRAGASLVQIYTSFIYGGPGTMRRILEELQGELDRSGLGSVQEWVGLDAR